MAGDLAGREAGRGENRPPSSRDGHKIWDPLRTPPAWRQPESGARTDAHPRMGANAAGVGPYVLYRNVTGETDERVADPICAGRGASLKCVVSSLRLGQPLRQETSGGLSFNGLSGI